MSGMIMSGDAEVAIENLLDALCIPWRGNRQMKDTPERVAKMYLEMFKGLSEEKPRMTVFPNDGYDAMVCLGPIAVRSVCSHHLLPFFGSAYLAYVPNKHIIGVSKLVRITRWFAERPQVQEELTCQIADELVKDLKRPIGVAVYIEATHTCMTARGVKEENTSKMKTSALRGCFLKKEAARSEFFAMVQKNGG